LRICDGGEAEDPLAHSTLKKILFPTTFHISASTSTSTATTGLAGCLMGELEERLRTAGRGALRFQSLPAIIARHCNNFNFDVNINFNFNNFLQDAFMSELEERLRTHWPRRGRLEVGARQPREGELTAHSAKSRR
jgi:hypothetical protein